MTPRLAIRYLTPLSNPRVPIRDMVYLAIPDQWKTHSLCGVEMATRMGFEPTIFGVTGQYVNRYTTGP